MSMHEPLIVTREVERGSDRSFGLVFAAAFALLGLLGWYHAGTPRIWPFAVAAVFLAAAWLAPRALSPLNRLWFRLGLLLHGVVTPVIMGVLFVGAFVPMGLLIRLFGADPLRLSRDPQAASYWIPREPPGPAAGSMSKQF